MLHARGMKTPLLACLALIAGITSAWSETYRSVPLSKLKIEGPAEEIGAALEMELGSYWLHKLDARLDGEAYLVPAKLDEDAFDQSELRLVFKGDAKLPLKGAIDLSKDYIASDLKTFLFTIPEGSATKIEEKEFTDARGTWYEARAQAGLPGTAWFSHRKNLDGREGEEGLNPVEVMDTFDIFSGGRAIADNLALDRDLILLAKKDEGMVRIDTIKGVTVKPIDWSKHMNDDPVEGDKLARLVPEDQHALFAPSLPGLLKLMSRIEAETTPMVGMISSESSYRGLMKRYRRQLGLDLTDIAARLLPVKSVAVTGGDLYFATGTDIAILMETENADALMKALELAVTSQAGAKPERHESGSFKRLSYVFPDKGISSHICRSRDVVYVTNSLVQADRIHGVVEFRAPSIGATLEYSAFRQRHPKADEHAFIFLSDATIRRWAGPLTRIGASRRNRALAALNELTCRKLSGSDQDFDEYEPLLGRVAMVEGRAISEHYGSAEFLTPISELPIGEVSESEKEAYERWREGYESGWTEVFDPIAIQLKVTKDSLDVDLTVLPLNVNSDIKEVMNIAGEGTLSPKARLRPQGSIMHLACALDSKGEFFQQFDQQLVEMMPELKIKPLSWVGESVSIELIDSLFWEGLAEMGIGGQIGKLPVVARVEVKSKLKLGLFLTAMRTLMQTSAPDTFEWVNRKHGERSYVVIEQVDEDDFGESIKICYAIVGKALVITLSERHLKKAMDLELHEFSEEQLAGLPKAKSMMIDVDPAMLNVIDKIDGGSAISSRQSEVSWDALPILNEWRRLFPDQDPRKTHQKLLGVSLDCPGGKGFRWNAEHKTMESVVFGHRGAPREPEKKQGLIKYGRMHSGIDFLDDGLRLRMHLGPKTKLLAVPDPEVGEVIGKGVELNSWKVGKTMTFAGESAYGPHRWSFETVSMEKTPKGTLVRSKEPWSDEEDEGVWEGSYLIDDKGVWYRDGKDETMTTTYTQAPLDMPLELRLNEVIRYESSGQNQYKEDEEEGIEEEDESFIERTEFRVLGLETVKTKAGTFADCVVIERYTESLWGDYYDAIENREWYHPGTGLIKMEDQDGYGGELIKTEQK